MYMPCAHVHYTVDGDIDDGGGVYRVGIMFVGSRVFLLILFLPRSDCNKLGWLFIVGFINIIV